MGEISTAELEKRIGERIKEIKEIVDFVCRITDAAGRVAKFIQDTSHINVESELNGFKDFSFTADIGQNMFGGHHFYVWYHPGKKEIDKTQIKPVFSVYFQSSIEESCEVLFFDSSTKWQNALHELIERQNEIIAEAKKQKTSQGRQRQLREKDRKKRERLLKRAKELML